MAMSSRILVVDDDPDIREVLGLVLGAEGLDVVSAYDGMDALEKLREDRSIALVVLDLMMPRMTGGELVKVLRGDPTLGRIPVVLLSGDVRCPEVAGELGVAAHLGKPVELATLTKAVWDALASAYPNNRSDARS
jgi:CheY-like chemotaxis protein